MSISAVRCGHVMAARWQHLIHHFFGDKTQGTKTFPIVCRGLEMLNVAQHFDLRSVWVRRPVAVVRTAESTDAAPEALC